MYRTRFDESTMVSVTRESIQVVRGKKGGLAHPDIRLLLQKLP